MSIDPTPHLHAAAFGSNARINEQGQLERQDLGDRLTLRAGEPGDPEQEVPLPNFSASGWLVVPEALAGDRKLRLAWLQAETRNVVSSITRTVAIPLAEGDRDVTSIAIIADFSGKLPAMGAYLFQASLEDAVVAEVPLFVTYAPKPEHEENFVLSSAPGDPGIVVAAGLPLELVGPSTDRQVAFLVDPAVEGFGGFRRTPDGVVIANELLTSVGPGMAPVVLSYDDPVKSVVRVGTFYTFRLLKIETAPGGDPRWRNYHLFVTRN